MLKLAAVFLLSATALQAQISFSDPGLGFAMELSDEYQVLGQDLLAPANRLGCWIRSSREQAGQWVRVCVERLPGALPQEELSGSDLPRSAKQMKFTWKGMDIQGVRADMDYEYDARIPVTAFVALVPIRAAGLRIRAEAPRQHASDAQAALVALLTTVQGETNWLSRGDRAEKAGESFGMIVTVIFAVGAGMWIMKRRQEKAA